MSCRSKLLAILFAGLTTFATFAGAATPALAQPANADADTSTQRTVSTADGWTLPISYWAVDNEEAPVVVLLHEQTKADRKLWGKLVAEKLNKAGYAVVAVDLRKQGDAKSARGAGGRNMGALDYRLMISQDLEAVKAFVLEQHQARKLNIAKTGFIAAGDMAVVAINWVASDWLKVPYADAPVLANRTPKGQDTKAMLLLSPETSLKGVSVTQPLNVLKKFPVDMLVLYGKDDRSAKSNVSKLDRLLGGSVGTYQAFALPSKNRGERLLQRGMRLSGTETADATVKFFDDKLKAKPFPWRDRKSKVFD